MPDLKGSGDKSGVISSGLTHVGENATEINNSGVEGKKVQGHIEIDDFQYIFRVVPGAIEVGGNNFIDALASGSDALQEILGEENPDFDFPIPNGSPSKSMDKEETGKIVPDSIVVTIQERYDLHRVFEKLTVSVRDTSNNFVMRRFKNYTTFDPIIEVKPLRK